MVSKSSALIIDELEAAAFLLTETEEMLSGVHSLTQGKLTPVLIPYNTLTNIIQQISQIMALQFPQFQVIYKDPTHYYMEIYYVSIWQIHWLIK